jgi:hypothetical protein
LDVFFIEASEILMCSSNEPAATVRPSRVEVRGPNGSVQVPLAYLPQS